MAFNFEKLEVYKKAVEFAHISYKTTKSFPKNEDYGLSSQLRRASLSISANIAEGSSRTFKQFACFLDIARGSLYECIPLLELALKEKYIAQDTFTELYNQCETLSKMISGLKKSLKSKFNH